MLKHIFSTIKDRIKTNNKFVNDVRIWNNQIDFSDKALGFKCPLVFVDFQNIKYNSYSAYLQEGICDVVIKFAVEDYEKDQLGTLDKKNQIVKSLNYWSAWQTPLIRTYEQTDSTSDSVYVFEITFSTVFYEDFSPCYIPMGGTSGNDWSFDVDIDYSTSGLC